MLTESNGGVLEIILIIFLSLNISNLQPRNAFTMSAMDIDAPISIGPQHREQTSAT
jgi:hypothetical protein